MRGFSGATRSGRPSPPRPSATSRPRARRSAFSPSFQREDGKIPHEISQSAAYLDWFEDYPYPWASADATPLFIIALADYWRLSADSAFVREHWPAARRAWAFSAATDRDGNGLVENTGVGHGWVEGGELYPPHEELYQQALFVQAGRDLAELARMMGEGDLAGAAERRAEQTLAAAEEMYWHEADGFYAFGTAFPGAPTLSEQAGPLTDADMRENTALLGEGNRGLGPLTVLRENTALQGVAHWWGLLDDARSQQAVTHYGAAGIATDWGARLLDKNSARYDPLSYHNGSVWALFTGWTSMGAYQYGRPHVGQQALYANALLTRQDALGYVTELLSGDYNTAFGRSSHHQIWSEAMVVSPLVRGLLGLHARPDTLRLAPQLPADWQRVDVRNAPFGSGTFDLAVTRTDRTYQIALTSFPGGMLELAPAFPRDAVVSGLRIDGREQPLPPMRAQGDVQRPEGLVVAGGETVVAEFTFSRRGSDVAVRHEPAEPGAVSQQPRVLRSEARADGLHLTLEGRAGSTARFALHTDRTPGTLSVPDVALLDAPATGAADGAAAPDYTIQVGFAGTPDQAGYVRRELVVPLD